MLADAMIINLAIISAHLILGESYGATVMPLDPTGSIHPRGSNGCVQR